MAASVPAKPTEIGARLDDALARYVVRRRASYGTTRAAVETYRIEVEKPEIHLISGRAPCEWQERA